MLSEKAKQFLIETILMQIEIVGEFAARNSVLPYLSTGDLNDDDLDQINAAIAAHRQKYDLDPVEENSETLELGENIG